MVHRILQDIYLDYHASGNNTLPHWIALTRPLVKTM